MFLSIDIQTASSRGTFYLKFRSIIYLRFDSQYSSKIYSLLTVETISKAETTYGFLMISRTDLCRKNLSERIVSFLKFYSGIINADNLTFYF